MPKTTPTKGANTINGIPNTPFVLASITTEPVASTTTMKVPMNSATNFFWFSVRFFDILLIKLCCKFPYSFIYLISDFSNSLYWFTFRILYSPVYHFGYIQSRAEIIVQASHVHYCSSVSYHIFCQIL